MKNNCSKIDRCGELILTYSEKLIVMKYYSPSDYTAMYCKVLQYTHPHHLDHGLTPGPSPVTPVMMTVTFYAAVMVLHN